MDALDSLIARVSRRLGFEWPSVDADDIRQHLWEYVLSPGNSVDVSNENHALNILYRAGRKYCSKEYSHGLSISPQYTYLPKDVRRILSDALDPARFGVGWIPGSARARSSGTGRAPQVDDDGRTLKDVMPEVPSIDTAEVHADVKRAFNALTLQDKQILFRVYVLGDDLPNGSPERKRLNRAVDALTSRINRYQQSDPSRTILGGPGSRRVIGNTQARARLASQDGGE